MKTYLVGGAVRDQLLGGVAQDRDWVVVGATPQDLLNQGFEQVGASFPVFLHPTTREEHALARTERKVGPGYHGFETVFDPSVTLVDDLARRDFTINSIAYDPETELYIDPFNGRGDLAAKVLRHTSVAFSEDPLRVIRLARFLARLPGLTAAPETFALAKLMVSRGDLNQLPPERFAAEINKVLSTCTPDGAVAFFSILQQLDVHVHVDFFRGFSPIRAALVASAVRSEVVESMRPTYFALLAGHTLDFCEQVGGALARDARQVFDLLEPLPLNMRRDLVVLEVLRRSGAWNNNPVFNTVLHGVRLASSLGRPTAVSFSELVQAEAVTTPLNDLGAKLVADGRSGPAIGAAIRSERLNALSFLND